MWMFTLSPQELASLTNALAWRSQFPKAGLVRESVHVIYGQVTSFDP